jgi:cytochrome c biogenesis protein CcmG, thiol:disulfide interchange protein DsbE
MRPLYILPFLAVILLGGGLAISLQHPPASTPESVLVGKKLPEFSLPSALGGKPVTAAQFAGKPLLINIFASWCMACLVEHPHLTALTQATGIPILGVAWKDSDADTTHWLKQHGNPYAAVAADHDGRLAINLGVTGAPETFIINAGGTIIYRFAGALTPDIIRQDILPRIKP